MTPANSSKESAQCAAISSSWERREERVRLPASGRYTVTVWHPAGEVGRFVFVSGDQEVRGGDPFFTAKRKDYWTPVVVNVRVPPGRDYVFQADDWLSKLAEKTYGDPLAYPLIIEGTNAKAEQDDTFAFISRPDAIKVGQKLWLPDGSENPASTGE